MSFHKGLVVQNVKRGTFIYTHVSQCVCCWRYDNNDWQKKQTDGGLAGGGLLAFVNSYTLGLECVPFYVVAHGALLIGVMRIN